MKRKQTTHFLAGMLTMLLILALSVPAMAAVSGKNITIYPGISIYLDDSKLNPTDVNGNPVEVFVYNGTTYLPVRAVSEALDIPVEWEASTRTVYLGKHKGSVDYLLSVCPPYQSYAYSAPSTVSMSGKKYAHCMHFMEHVPSGFALFNLDGQYDTLTFTAGHMDGRNMSTTTYNFYLDGELTYSIDLDSGALPEEYELDLDGALQLKIEQDGWGVFAFADMQVS